MQDELNPIGYILTFCMLNAKKNNTTGGLLQYLNDYVLKVAKKIAECNYTLPHLHP